MELFEQGKFSVGCNYWASHAGTNMWSDWQPDIIEADFARLQKHNVHLLRVFPLWSVFQPISALYGQAGVFREYYMGDEPLPDTPEGQAGVSVEALEKFAQFCELAKKYNIRFVVGLITGWMSGRLFVPPALEGRNILTDPTAIMWQVRYVRCFTKRFLKEEAIVAWDLGNECNVLAPFDTAEELYNWASSIAGAIRMQDAERPIISGMHGLLPEGKWNIFHQAELTDLLTTHPYPLFTEHCDQAPINTLRTVLHSTAETLFYRGIGRKPCFVEEAGTLGNMLGDEETAGAYVRTCLYSLWAHDCRGYLWWCANEQSHLKHPPYDWNAIERELGMFRLDGSPKPVMREMETFSEFMEGFEYETLPPRIVDGVCILTRGQDYWGNAYMSFVLAKQAGMDIEFAYAEQELPDAPLYLMPGVCGDDAITSRRMRQLMEKVEKGALLYISLDDGLLSGMENLCGVRSKGRERFEETKNVSFELDEEFSTSLYYKYVMKLEECGAEVLARDEDGNPVCVIQRHGNGVVVLLTAAVEMQLAHKHGRIMEEPGYYRIYQYLRHFIPDRKIAKIDNVNVGLTEHIVDENRRILVLINYDPDPVEVQLHLEKGWKIEKMHRGTLQLAENDCSVLECYADNRLI